jgi:hypothetical protein
MEPLNRREDSYPRVSTKMRRHFRLGGDQNQDRVETKDFGPASAHERPVIHIGRIEVARDERARKSEFAAAAL